MFFSAGMAEWKIELVFNGEFTESRQQVFRQAADRCVIFMRCLVLSHQTIFFLSSFSGRQIKYESSTFSLVL